CYGDNTDSAEFSLGPNEIGNLDAHYYPGNTGGSGTTRVKVYEVGNPSNQVVLTFVGSTFAASVTEIKKLEFKLYPIPATDVLFLKASKNLTAGKIEIYNAIGKKMHEMVISNSQQAIEIPVHSLPKGNYILRVF